MPDVRRPAPEAPLAAERLLLKAPFEFRRERVPLDGPAAPDYVVRVDVCGLCRSDLHTAASWAIGWQESGHEFGGTVVAVNRPRARFGVGARVAVRNASSCGQCVRCQDGDPRACAALVVNMQGFRDFAACDERSLVPAGSLDDESLALVEPTNVALDLLHSSALDASRRVAVMGAGTLGLLTAFVAQQVYRHPDVVLVGRRADSPLADAIGIRTYVPFERAARDEHGRRRLADRVLVTTPPSTLESALSLCQHRGWIVTVGLDEVDGFRTGLDVSRLIFGQHTLRGVCAAPNAYFEQAVDVLEQYGDLLKRLVTRRVRRADLEATLAEWPSRPQYEGKAIVVNAPEAA
jgi:threonine dehydrogenase-like Zn-dependent dehydrogenase